MNRYTVPVFIITVSMFLSCTDSGVENNSLEEALQSLNLKKGTIISCAPPGDEFGKVDFDISCSDDLKPDFNLAVALLHSFEYDEAEKAFSKIIEQDPRCPMAYWGVAMSNFHTLWEPPGIDNLKKGAKSTEIAKSLKIKSEKEKKYIDAISVFYHDWEKLSHKERTQRYKKAMEKIYTRYPGDKEAAIFYALALRAAADPGDKTFADQKKAGEILSSIFPDKPDHPGLAHYLIHTYDYPELADLALPAARKYAAIAPASAHAQHMPSHIFTRLGLWQESIQSNLASISSATCYAESAGIEGHWDEELHGMDYLTYAYLQRGEDELAKAQLEHLNTIKKVYPVNFKVAYAFAAIPSRFYLEKKMWKEAANLSIMPQNFPWDDFPWQKAIFHFARLLGAVHLDNLDNARTELKKLEFLKAKLLNDQKEYEANQVTIQEKTGQAWILLKEGRKERAVNLMKQAAEMEYHTEKHPVTPCEVLPARELLADMLMETGDYEGAALTYQFDLQRHPNRLNGLYGAARAFEMAGKKDSAAIYYTKLMNIADHADAGKEQVETASSFLTAK